MAAFKFFWFKKYLRQISILGTKKYKLIKTKGTFVISTFKVDYMVPSVFLIFLFFGTKN